MVHHHLKKTTSMSTDEIYPLIDTPMSLGETPLWHPGESALYWIDIVDKSVHRFRPSDGSYHRWNTPSEPGCIAYCEAGGLLVAMRSGIAKLDAVSGNLIPYINSPYDTLKIRFNDGRCDANGRLWVGTLSDDRTQQAGELFCFDRGTLRSVGNPVTVSNGVAFSCDGKTLYHTDTTAHTIMAYEFDMPTGEIGARRVFRHFSSNRDSGYIGRPDGAAVDSEDAYWCAMYEGGRLLRLAADGTILQEILLPARCPTMLAFGGEDLKTLFITTVRHNRSQEELARYPLSGYVLTCRVEVPGKPEYGYIE
jgi:sugar lactone lactonase YvrE